jgi:hypothetical protein
MSAPGDHPRGGSLDELVVGADEALQQLVDGVEGIVDQLLEHVPTIPPSTTPGRARRGRCATS